VLTAIPIGVISEGVCHAILIPKDSHNAPSFKAGVIPPI